MPVNTKDTLLYNSCQSVAYADDINIMLRSFTSANEIFIKINETANEVGLRIKENKRKIMPLTRKMTATRRNVTIEGYNFENEDNFICLGVQLMKRRNQLANTVY